jgi:hypothetical protein
MDTFNGLSLANFCACIGPMYGEPYCGCQMKRKGIPLNTEARKKENERAEKQLVNLSKWFEDNRKLTQQEKESVEQKSQPSAV